MATEAERRAFVHGMSTGIKLCASKGEVHAMVISAIVATAWHLELGKEPASVHEEWHRQVVDIINQFNAEKRDNAIAASMAKRG